MGDGHHRCCLALLASEFPNRIAIDSSQGVIDRHTRIPIEPMTPVEPDIKSRHDDAYNPEGYRRTILEPDGLEIPAF